MPTPSGVLTRERSVHWHASVWRRVERVAEVLDRLLPGLTSLPARPCLGLREQRAQLLDELARGRSRAVEGLDPLESLENRLGLVHVLDRSPASLAAG